MVPFSARPAATRPQAAADFVAAAGGSTADHDARERRRLLDAAGLDRRPRPQGVDPLLDDLAENLLTPEPRAGIAREDGVEKTRREVARIVGGGPRVTMVLRSAISRLIRAIGRGVGGDHLARPRAEAERELQHVEGRVGMAPLGELVAPGGGELRAAQAFRITAEKACATTPLLHSRRRRDGVQVGRLSRGVSCMSPETPSIITSRTSCSLSPTSAIGPTASPRRASCRAPWPAPIGRRRASCPRRGRRAAARWSTGCRRAGPPAAADDRGRRR